MMDIPTYQELEGILKTIIKLPNMGVAYVSEQTGIGKSCLYNWTCGYSHLGAEKIDILIKWIKTNKPDLIPIAIKIYKGVN